MAALAAVFVVGAGVVIGGGNRPTKGEASIPEAAGCAETDGGGVAPDAGCKIKLFFSMRTTIYAMNPTINSMILSLPDGLGQSVQCPDGRMTITGLRMGVDAQQVEVRLLLTLAEVTPSLAALLEGGVGGSVEALQARRGAA